MSEMEINPEDYDIIEDSEVLWAVGYDNKAMDATHDPEESQSVYEFGDEIESTFKSTESLDTVLGCKKKVSFDEMCYSEDGPKRKISSLGSVDSQPTTPTSEGYFSLPEFPMEDSDGDLTEDDDCGQRRVVELRSRSSSTIETANGRRRRSSVFDSLKAFLRKGSGKKYDDH